MTENAFRDTPAHPGRYAPTCHGRDGRKAAHEGRDGQYIKTVRSLLRLRESRAGAHTLLSPTFQSECVFHAYERPRADDIVEADMIKEQILCLIPRCPQVQCASSVAFHDPEGDSR